MAARSKKSATDTRQSLASIGSLTLLSRLVLKRWVEQLVMSLYRTGEANMPKLMKISTFADEYFAKGSAPTVKKCAVLIGSNK